MIRFQAIKDLANEGGISILASYLKMGLKIPVDLRQ